MTDMETRADSAPELLDARRLTGPNVVADGPGSILDVAIDTARRDDFVAAWKRHLRRMRADIGWSDTATFVRKLEGGVSVAFHAPIDALYAATAVNEWAFAAASAELDGGEAPDYAAALAGVRADIEQEANAPLMSLAAAAAERSVTLLWDDDEVSLGMGAASRTWPARELPPPDGLDWTGFDDLPVGLVTGTNGKTTTVRLARHIVQAAGRVAGLCSTDWIAVGDEILDRDDWSGPGGARTVLRHPQVTTAILETARGGLLRRGLGVERADVAVITNIAADHLGDFGSRNLHELLDIKWVVSRAVTRRGSLVLNADDARLVARARDYGGRIVWFGLDADSERIARHVEAGGAAWVAAGDELLRLAKGAREQLCSARDIPITLGGAARHNVANALAAAALCEGLGIDLETIRAGLGSMPPDENPGRCNLYELPDCRVLVDFAHNPHAMQALFDMARSLPARRRVLAFSQAGDRTDSQIRELASSAWAVGVDHVIVAELEKYRRGREPGEVYELIRAQLVDEGAREDQVEHCPDELASLAAALGRAGRGDLVIMLALADSAGVRARLRELQAGGREP